MKKGLSLLLLTFLTFQIAYSQKVAIIYVYPSDAHATNLWQLTDLQTHFNGPVKNFWAEQSYGKYNPEITIFHWMMPIPTPAASSANGTYYLPIDMMKAKLPNGGDIAIPGYVPTDYNQNIFLLGGGFIGYGGGFTKYTLKVNGQNYSNVSAGSFAYLHPNDQYYSSGIQFEYYLPNKPYRGTANGETIKYTELGLNGDDGTLLHEWGHGLGLSTHANYWRSDVEPMYGDIHYWTEKSFWKQTYDYGNQFDVMGGGPKYSLHLNAFYKDLLGWLSPAEKSTLTASSRDVRILPLESQTNQIKAIQIPALGFSRPSPFDNALDYSYYLEYRQPLGLDKHLSHDYLKSNTNGLMICMTRRKGDVFVNSWLLDMSPDDIVYQRSPNDIADNTYTDQDDHHEASLNAGKTFYDEQTEVCFTNIRPDAVNGLTFDFEKGVKTGVTSGVYTTALFNDQVLNGQNAKILYSSDLAYYLLIQPDGNIVIKKSSDDSFVWGGVSAGITLNGSLSQIKLVNGNFSVAANGTNVWSSNTNGFSNAKLIITTAGELQVINMNDNSIIWPIPVTPSINGSDPSDLATNNLLNNPGFNGTPSFNQWELEVVDPYIANLPGDGFCWLNHNNELGDPAVKQAITNLIPGKEYEIIVGWRGGNHGPIHGVSGARDIFAIDIDGSEIKRLTTNTNYVDWMINDQIESSNTYTKIKFTATSTTHTIRFRGEVGADGDVLLGWVKLIQL